MKIVIQRTERASVSVDGNRTFQSQRREGGTDAAQPSVDRRTVGAIDKGFLVLLGVGAEDTEADCERLAKKLIGLRIFEDENGKTNLSLKDVNGSLLIISQFTLYADCRKGNRPNFLMAKEPKEAERLYEYFCELCGREIPVVEKGVFGAEMRVELVNSGPFTIILE